MKNVVSVGTSEEDRTASKINRTSAVENGETSAVGRMLGNLGLHGGQMASVEEVLNAQKTGTVVELRNRAGSKMKEFQKTYSEKGTQTEVDNYLIEKQEFLNWLKANDPETHTLTMKQINEFKASLPEE
jgi:Zn/Cd-binding protein ZinT